MRNSFLAIVGAMSLALTGCGAEADKRASDGEPKDLGAHASDEVGVSTSELTGCTRTELANTVVWCEGAHASCAFRLMQNNFACAEGIVGQASTETLVGRGDTFTEVATLLFGEQFTGVNGPGAVTIATQWGHAFASTHQTLCVDGDGLELYAAWHLDPWTKEAKFDEELRGDWKCINHP